YVGRGVAQPDETVTITVSLVRPRSRGSIALRSPDPFSAPAISAHYLQDDADAVALVRGARLARELGSARAFDNLRSAELEPGAQASSDRDLDRFVRQQA